VSLKRGVVAVLVKEVASPDASPARSPRRADVMLGSRPLGAVVSESWANLIDEGDRVALGAAVRPEVDAAGAAGEYTVVVLRPRATTSAVSFRHTSCGSSSWRARTLTDATPIEYAGQVDAAAAIPEIGPTQVRHVRRWRRRHGVTLRLRCHEFRRLSV